MWKWLKRLRRKPRKSDVCVYAVVWSGDFASIPVMVCATRAIAEEWAGFLGRSFGMYHVQSIRVKFGSPDTRKPE